LARRASQAGGHDEEHEEAEDRGRSSAGQQGQRGDEGAIGYELDACKRAAWPKRPHDDRKLSEGPGEVKRQQQ
jgi:hypothetical protein